MAEFCHPEFGCDCSEESLVRRVTELEDGIRRYLAGEGYSEDLLSLLGDES